MAYRPSGSAPRVADSRWDTPRASTVSTRAAPSVRSARSARAAAASVQAPTAEPSIARPTVTSTIARCTPGRRPSDSRARPWPTRPRARSRRPTAAATGTRARAAIRPVASATRAGVSRARSPCDAAPRCGLAGVPGAEGGERPARLPHPGPAAHRARAALHPLPRRVRGAAAAPGDHGNQGVRRVSGDPRPGHLASWRSPPRAGRTASSGALFPRRCAPQSRAHPAARVTLAGFGQLDVEPVGPARVGCAVAEHPPGRSLGCGGYRRETPAELGWRLVALAVVAPGAGGHHVVPRVPAAAAPRQHVVDGLGRTLAVGAPPAVSREDRPAGQPDVGRSEE